MPRGRRPMSSLRGPISTATSSLRSLPSRGRSEILARWRRCATRSGGGAAGGLPLCELSTINSLWTLPRRSSRWRKAIPLARQIALLYMYEGKFAEAASWLERALELSRRPDCFPGNSGQHACPAGHRRPAAGRDRELPGVRRPVELHLPDRREAVHIAAGRLARGGQAVHRLPGGVARRPAGPLAAEHRLHDAGRVPREGPARVPDPARPIPVEARRGPVRERRAAGRPGRTGARTWPAAASSTISTATACPTCSRPRSTPTWGPRCSSTAATARSRTARPRPASSQQVYALNVARADFDNDGDLDVVLLRGAWEKPARLSLLRNKGGGVFEDVTIASGLGEPIATESAAWGDYDNDGRLDLFVCGEYHARVARSPPNAAGSTTTRATARSTTSPRRPASSMTACAKGSAWGDYDGDGRLDLFVSNMRRACRLYHNEGDGTFRDVARELGVAGPSHNQLFACWFWDFDNDGRLDLFVNDYKARLADVAGLLHRPEGGRTAAIPASTATSASRASATSAWRSASTGRSRRWGRTSATSTTTATSTSTSGPAGCPTRAWSPT